MRHYLSFAAALLVSCMFCKTVPAQSGGVVYREYGTSDNFWLTHEAVRGVIRRWDLREEHDYMFQIRVIESLPGSYAYGQELRGRHRPNAGSRFLVSDSNRGGGPVEPPEDLLSHIAVGDEVIVILKKEHRGPEGEVSLPDGSDAWYSMMPNKGRPLYRIKGKSDPLADETVRMCRVSATSQSLSQKVNAAFTLLTEHPNNERIIEFARGYLERVVAGAEKTLRYARSQLSASFGHPE